MKKISFMGVLILGILLTACGPRVSEERRAEITQFVNNAEYFLTSHYQMYDSVYFEREDSSIQAFRVLASSVGTVSIPDETDDVDENGDATIQYEYGNITIGLCMANKNQNLSVEMSFAINEEIEFYWFQIRGKDDKDVPLEYKIPDFSQDTIQLSNTLGQTCLLTRERGIIYMSDAKGHTWTAVEQ